MFTITNISASSPQAVKQSVNILGARLHPGGSRDVEALTPHILGLIDAGIVSSTPPPNVETTPVSEVAEKVAPEATDASETIETDDDIDTDTDADETDSEDTEEDADADAEVIVADESETPEESEEVIKDVDADAPEVIKDDDSTEEEVITSDESAEETVEAVVDEDAENADSPAEVSEAPAPFDVAEFMTGHGRDVLARIKDMDKAVLNLHKSEMIEYEEANAGRTSILSVL